jgi:hypothetical protein
MFANERSQFRKARGSVRPGTLWPWSFIKCPSGGSNGEVGFFVAGQGINSHYDIMRGTAAIKGFC